MTSFFKGQISQEKGQKVLPVHQDQEAYHQAADEDPLHVRPDENHEPANGYVGSNLKQR